MVLPSVLLPLLVVGEGAAQFSLNGNGKRFGAPNCLPSSSAPSPTDQASLLDFTYPAEFRA